MRRLLALFVLLAVPAFADEPKPLSFFARSQHYSMNVEINGDVYDVTVVDLSTSSVVSQPHLVLGAGHSSDVRHTNIGEVDIQVFVQRGPYGVRTSLEVSKGNTIVDSIDSRWTLAPHERPPAGAGGGAIGGVIGGTVKEPPPLPPDTYRVGGDVKAPHIIHRVEPTYPAEARRAGVSGIVIVQALIDKTGIVRDVQVLKPMPYGLDQAAVDAVKQWRFEPATKDGKPVDVIFALTVSFKIATPPSPPNR